jgi:hypothetical protein
LEQLNWSVCELELHISSSLNINESDGEEEREEKEVITMAQTTIKPESNLIASSLRARSKQQSTRKYFVKFHDIFSTFF